MGRWEVDGVPFEKPKRKGGNRGRQLEEAREWKRLTGRSTAAALKLTTGFGVDCLMWPDITTHTLEASSKPRQPRPNKKALLDGPGLVELVDKCKAAKANWMAAGEGCHACDATRVAASHARKAHTCEKGWRKELKRTLPVRLEEVLNQIQSEDAAALEPSSAASAEPRSSPKPRMTDKGETMLKKLQKKPPGKIPRKWAEEVYNMIETKVAQDDVTAAARVLTTTVSDESVETRVAQGESLTGEDEVRVKDVLPLPDGLVYRIETRQDPPPGLPDKGIGVYYDGIVPLINPLGNYRAGAQVVSTVTANYLLENGEGDYLMRLATQRVPSARTAAAVKTAGGTAGAVKAAHELAFDAEQTIVDGNPKTSRNWLAFINMPDDGTCWCRDECGGKCTAAVDRGEKGNVTIRYNGDFVFTGEQFKPGFLNAYYDQRDTTVHAGRCKRRRTDAYRR